MAQRLYDQIQYFGSREDALPEWREAARLPNPDEVWRHWPSLPIVTKDMLRTRFPADEMGKRFGLTGQVNSTGGSTGEPTRFFEDVETQKRSLAAQYYAWRQMGWREGMPVITVWGSERDIGKQMHWKPRLGNHLLNIHLVHGYGLTRQTAESVANVMRRRGPVVIYGFTSMLQYVAEQILESGTAIPPGAVRAAWNGGEMLFASQSESFQKAFGTPILNSYGGRELSLMAFQPSAGAQLRVTRPWLMVEIVNEQGRPVGPGEPGRLIWTSTMCRGTPFLRYEIEDLGSFDAAGCDESGIFALKELQGRIGGLYKLPDGRTVNNLYWNHLFKGFPEVSQFQVIIKATQGLDILLTGKGFTPARHEELITTAGRFLGPVPLSAKWVDRIPLTKQGKLVQVVREKD